MPMDASDATTMGMMNAFRTGNVVVDTVISSCLCMLLPLLLTNAQKIGTASWEGLVAAWVYMTVTPKEEYVRVIDYVEKTYSWGGRMDTIDEKNHILQKAIIMQLGTVLVFGQGALEDAIGAHACSLQLRSVEASRACDQ
jgi:hypothetical protein